MPERWIVGFIEVSRNERLSAGLGLWVCSLLCAPGQNRMVRADKKTGDPLPLFAKEAGRSVCGAAYEVADCSIPQDDDIGWSANIGRG